eukprot:g3989.t1
MGSAYPTIAADVISRFQRLQGREVCFLTGTDEHGEKIATAAKKRGLHPQDHCDEIVELYKHLWQQLDIKYDRFIRTSSEAHEKFVQEVLERVWSKGDIYLDTYEGYYCVDCEEYKDADQMDDQHQCLIHKKPCEYRKEENYFFRLSKYQKQIEKLLDSNISFVQPISRRNEVLGWVKSGLKDFSISRLALDWGIPMQEDPKHTVYVWFDALNGYISGLFPPGNEPSLSGVESMGWPANAHLIGKDILRFHAVYWPAMLLSADLALPDRVFGHGFLTKDGMKMGKSLGNILDPVELLEHYGSDAVRYYFMKEIIFGQDGDFNEQRFRDVINAALANDLGNLLNRTLTLLKKNSDSVIPISSDAFGLNHPVRKTVESTVPKIAEAYENFNFTRACEGVLEITGRGNLYLQETSPWTALKKGSEIEKSKALEVLVSVLESLRIVAVVLTPIAPSISSKVYCQLGLTHYQSIQWSDAQWGQLKAGHRTKLPDPVFKRLDGKFLTQEMEAKV